MNSASIKQLYIYPIKGLAGIALQMSEVEYTGLKYDRQWMLINKKDKLFLSQRSQPLLSLMRPSMNDHQVSICYNNAVHTIIPEDRNITFNASIWKDEVMVSEVSKESSAWFSDHLGLDCMLVKRHRSADRYKLLINEPYVAPLLFPDGYPILILGTESLNKLNHQLEEKIEFNRFRPNIVVETAIAHEEDLWSVISTSNVKLKIIKPCIRCQVINIDQSNGSSGLEPTKTLATYRLSNEGISFGANTICLDGGKLTIGDQFLID